MSQIHFMKKFKFIPLLYFLIAFQGCTSVETKHQNTVAPSVLDGAWTRATCTCAGKEINSSDQQVAHTLFINGNLLFQDQISRLKSAELNRDCSIHQEATITRITDDSYNVTTVSERTFSPGTSNCKIYPGKLNRTWKIIVANKSDLKYESTGGCETGPYICSFKRLDQ